MVSRDANLSAADELQRLSAALALSERDRQLIGFEIHDGIIQDLTAAAMQLEGAGRQATFPSAEVEDTYAGGLRLLRASIAEARRLIRGLVTAELGEQGLVAALSRLVEKFRNDLALPVALTVDAAEFSLPASAQHLLLRIAQEALFNVWKHAQATQIEVGLHVRGQELTLSIADNGVGFNPQQAPPGHYGIAGLRKRAEILGAQLTLGSSPGQGTRVAVRLPLAPG